MPVAPRLLRLLAGLFTIVWSCAAWAETSDCATGKNLIAQMPEAERSALQARADAVPFPRGNLWTARKGDQLIHLVGTYHLADPRMDGMLAQVTPLLSGAQGLLVEAGPEEEKALLAHISRDPSVLLLPLDNDETIDRQLSPEEWAILSKALQDRSIPTGIGKRFQPWYLSVLLAIPACALDETGSAEGLDKALIDSAEAAQIPVHALEPYDTAIRIFAEMSASDQLSMIRTTIATLNQVEDFNVTLADAYFAGEARLIWELMRQISSQMPGESPEKVDVELARMEEALISRRNQSWIPVLEDAASGGPVLAAFGAMHLSGEQGVLNLLAQRGWKVEPLRP